MLTPLESVTKSVDLWVAAANHRLDNTDTDDLAKTPTKVDIACEVSSKSDGADFRSIGDTHCGRQLINR